MSIWNILKLAFLKNILLKLFYIKIFEEEKLGCGQI